MKSKLFTLFGVTVIGTNLCVSASLHGATYSIGDWTSYGLPTSSSAYKSGSFSAVMGGGDVTMTFGSQVSFGASTNYGGTLWIRPESGVGNYGTITISFDKLVTGFSFDVGAMDSDNSNNPGMPNEMLTIKSINGMSYADWKNAGHNAVKTTAKNTFSAFTNGSFDSSSGDIYTTASSGGMGIDFQAEAISSIELEFKAVGTVWGAGIMMDNIGFSTTPIPEPSTMGLAGSAALLGMILICKRRKK